MEYLHRLWSTSLRSMRCIFDKKLRYKVKQKCRYHCARDHCQGKQDISIYIDNISMKIHGKHTVHQVYFQRYPSEKSEYFIPDGKLQ